MIHNNLKVGMLFVLMASLVSLGANAQAPGGNKDRQQPPSTEELIKMMDSNKDGKLSVKEVKGPLKDDFSKIDTNKDGFITKAELDKAPKPNGKGGKQQGQQQSNSEKKEPNMEELIKMMDSNKDGKLSKEEVKGPLEKDFAKIDTNKDGFLTKVELEKAPKQNKGEKKE
jgi:Ca2+-binding EF-hand superfamily protein